MKVKTGLGVDSHRFVENGVPKPLTLGGLRFDDAPGLSGNSDADVLLHALTDAIAGITGRPVIGERADAMCLAGITDSREYLKVALAELGHWKIRHVSAVLECRCPPIHPKAPALCRSVARMLGLTVDDVCLTATSGEGLSDVGRGQGVRAMVVVTATRP